MTVDTGEMKISRCVACGGPLMLGGEVVIIGEGGPRHEECDGRESPFAAFAGVEEERLIAPDEWPEESA